MINELIYQPSNYRVQGVAIRNFRQLMTFASHVHQILCFHVTISVDIVVFMETHMSCTEGRALCAALSSAKEKEMQYVAVGLDSMTHLHELVNQWETLDQHKDMLADRLGSWADQVDQQCSSAYSAEELACFFYTYTRVQKLLEIIRCTAFRIHIFPAQIHFIPVH